MANVPQAKVKALCTAAEAELVKASRRPEIGQLDARALKQYVTQARKLRDKWRDQSTKQRRDTQQRHNARVADDEKRSEQKAEIFEATLTAFEKQLEKVSTTGTDSGKAAPKKKAAKSTPKPDHRADRASKRGALEAQREEMNAVAATKKPAKKKVAKKTAEKGTATSAPTTKAASTKKVATKKVAKKKVAKKGVYAAAAKKAVKSLLNQPTDLETAAKSTKGAQSDGLVGPVNAKKQRGAQTAAIQERLDRSGVRSRLKGHASASGRRSQGKRDSRG